MAKKQRPTIGADPEVLLLKKGKPIAAWDQTTGRKDAPIPMLSSDYGLFMAHSDNVAYEINFPKLTIGNGHFYMATNFLMGSLETVAKAQWKAVPFAEFDPETLQHPLASTAGCSVDFCAYDADPEKERDPPVIADWGNKRFFGGHIHIGYPSSFEIKPHHMAKLCDLFLTVPAIAGGADKQGARREWYGRAGIFRPKPYGLEYRTLSNFWLNPQAMHARTIERNIASLTGMLTSHRKAVVDLYNQFSWGLLQDAINQEDVGKCTDLFMGVSSWITHNVGGSYEPRMFV